MGSELLAKTFPQEYAFTEIQGLQLELEYFGARLVFFNIIPCARQSLIMHFTEL